MDEDAARAWIASLPGVSRETLDRLDRYAARLIAENQAQNLIASASERIIWSRHFADSCQLAPLACGNVLDVGSGAGLPGIPLAILGFCVTLVEPRRRRADFLLGTVEQLGLEARVLPIRVERVTDSPFDTIVARAYAPLDRVFASVAHLAHHGTRWVLPKGRSGPAELENARRAWHGDFETIPSITDPDAVIIIARRVRPKAKR
ncbi:MAG: 16S rRNA (guanine(527)-N(7))-methyltransferase RsmG [Sphingomonadaceae bacterium]|nr:16S rRNA (guanine(527)-N(7))-methyltransferase RsmG [Sphingomonadaceae bacterium]